MAGVFKRRGRWVADFRDQAGKRHQYFRRTKADAEAALLKMKAFAREEAFRVELPNGYSQEDMKSGGVYFIFKNGALAYIGQSSFLIKRISSHIGKGCRFEGCQFALFPMAGSSVESRLRLEGFLIASLKPPFQRHSPSEIVLTDEEVASLRTALEAMDASFGTWP